MVAISSHKKQILLVAVFILLLLGVAAFGKFASTGKSLTGDSFSLLAIVNKDHTKVTPSSAKALENIAANYKAHFRDGCELTTPTAFSYADGKTLSVYLATCKKGFPEKIYRAGDFMGHDALFEDDVADGSSTLPSIVVLKRISIETTASQSVREAKILSEVGVLSGEIKAALRQISVKTGKDFSNFEIAFQTLHDGTVLLILQDSSRLTRVGFFDRTMINVTP
jgi:hypothetical protein